MNRINEYIEKLKNTKKGIGIKIIVFLGIAGMALILLSDVFIPSEKKADKALSETQNISGEYDTYVSNMEIKLNDILESIDGVGKSKVMITAEGTEEYIYAEEEKTNSDGDSMSKESQYVIVGNASNKEALLKKVINPEISGVVIVCDGGDSNVIKEQIYKAVSAAFDVPSGRIFVSKLME